MGKVTIKRISPRETPLLYSQVLHLRNQVLRLPIGLDLFKEDLSQEVNHVILVATTKRKEEKRARLQDGNAKLEEKVVGCLILTPVEGDEKTFKIRQMAVSPDFQGQALGSKLIKRAEEYAKENGKTRLYLHGRVQAVGFYLKLGYSKITENEFLELGVPRYAMEKIL